MEPNIVNVYCSNFTCDCLDCPKNIENVKEDGSELVRFSNFEGKPECRKKQPPKEYYCNNLICTLKDCPKHFENIDSSVKNAHFVHLDGNPMYCIKRDWNNNQYKEDTDA